MLLVFTCIIGVGILSIIVAVYILIPIFYLFNPQQFIAIMYYYKDNPFKNQLAELNIFDLSLITSRSFFIESEFDGTRIGAWQILPFEQEVTGDVLNDEQFEKRLDDGFPIFVYLHGVSGNRAVPHRVAVYKLLSRLGYHVLTLDYRGFGDSQGKPKFEDDIVSDAASLIQFARKHAPNSNLFIWGHSLGSGVACSCYRHLQERGQEHYIQGILIDAGFDRLAPAVFQHRNLQLYRPKKLIRSVVNSIFKSANIEYHSIKNLQNASVPISIIHSEDDGTIAFEIGKQLHIELQNHIKDLTFINLGKNGCGHLYNYTFSEIVEIVRDLVQRAENSNRPT